MCDRLILALESESFWPSIQVDHWHDIQVGVQVSITRAKFRVTEFTGNRPAAAAAHHGGGGVTDQAKGWLCLCTNS